MTYQMTDREASIYLAEQNLAVAQTNWDNDRSKLNAEVLAEAHARLAKLVSKPEPVPTLGPPTTPVDVLGWFQDLVRDLMGRLIDVSRSAAQSDQNARAIIGHLTEQRDAAVRSLDKKLDIERSLNEALKKLDLVTGQLNAERAKKRKRRR